MKNDSSKDYYDFYMEIPPTDYLKDIEIQDEYEKPTDQNSRGLSDEQVSQIAIDSLSNAQLPNTHSQTGDTNTQVTSD
jgi:hypothetical protein